MKYSVDETTKTITIEGSPSLFAFVEMMNKRFPNDEWKKYELKFKTLEAYLANKPYVNIFDIKKDNLEKLEKELGVTADVMVDICFANSERELRKILKRADKNSQVRGVRPPSNISIA